MNAPVPHAAPPEPEGPEEEQFQIYSRVEILALLREIQSLHALVTIYYGVGRSFALSTVLAVNPDFEEVVLDAPAHRDECEGVVRAQRLVLVTFLHHVKIQFRAVRAEHTTFDGRPAIRIRLPDAMLRFQRRDAYRVQTPIANPLRIQVPESGDQPRMSLRVYDLSCGGAGVQVAPDAPAPEPGQRLRGCSLELPGIGTLVADIEVRYVMRSGAPASAGPAVTRCGLQFLDPGAAQVALVQRYINRLERDRRMRT